MWDINHNFMPKGFDKILIGFDPIVKKMAEAAEQTVKLAQNYPPYNIKKIDENRYVIEVAVAGFGKQDLDIELADGKLVVKGNTKSDEPSHDDKWDSPERFAGGWKGPQILYQGLAMRPFTRTWTLADNVEIKGGELVNGVLKIWLESFIPESKKVKIDIIEKEDKEKQ